MTTLNDSQKRSILFGFLDIHRRMAELEAKIAQSMITSPFSQLVNDLSPTESKVAQDYFARIRTTMLACLQEAGIPLEVRRTSVRWGVEVGTTFLHIAVAELSPESLRGYGPMEANSAAVVSKMQQDLYRLIDRVRVYLQQGLGRDLQQRLAHLSASPTNVTTLTLLEKSSRAGNWSSSARYWTPSSDSWRSPSSRLPFSDALAPASPRC